MVNHGQYTTINTRQYKAKQGKEILAASIATFNPTEKQSYFAAVSSTKKVHVKKDMTGWSYDRLVV